MRAAIRMNTYAGETLDTGMLDGDDEGRCRCVSGSRVFEEEGVVVRDQETDNTSNLYTN